MSDVAKTDRMPVERALGRLSERRSDREIVVSNMASARLFPRLSDHSLDFHYNPSAMGGAVPFAVGLALSRPDLGVIALSGEGSLLMSLGCLVTAVASGAKNLTVVLLDNGMYEVTGGQDTAATALSVDYVGLARASGFTQASAFDTIEIWDREIDSFFDAAGPRFAWLKVGPTPAEVFGDKWSPVSERIERFRDAIASISG